MEPNNIYTSITKKLKIKLIAQSEELSDLEKQLASNTNSPNVIEYKILIVGEHLSGKTSFCLRFALNEFNLEIKSSVQTECYLKTMQLFDKEIKVYLIDVEVNSFKHPQEELFRDVKGAIIIYDITKIATFEAKEKLIGEIRQKIGNVIPILLVGNKNDLKFLRNVDFEEANEKANSLNCELREINCIDEEMVHNTMKYLVAKIFFEDLDDEQKERIKSNFSNNNTNTTE